MTHYRQNDLVEPTLRLLARQPEGIPTAELIELLTAQLGVDGDDLEPYPSRSDSRFSQTVRNLKSHDAFERHGYARYDAELRGFVITEAGLAYVSRLPDGEAARSNPGREERRAAGVRFGAYRTADEDPGTDVRDPFTVDPDAVDRALSAHARTQNALATWVGNHDLTPQSPEDTAVAFDVAWQDRDVLFVAEVKSLPPQSETRQLRLGLGQVLDYRSRLLDDRADVHAVLAVEREPSEIAHWEGLCQEHGVTLVWPAVFDRLLDPMEPAREGT